MSDTGARPWWAEVQHLRPAEDREREQRTRHARDAALEEVRATADERSRTTGSAPARSRFARAAEAFGSVATLERAAGDDAGSERRDRFAAGDDDSGFERRDRVAGADASASSFDDELASWLDETPAGRARDIELVVDPPLPVDEPRTRERFTTDDWLALTAPTERRDPETGRRTIEIRGQVDGPRGLAPAGRDASGVTARQRPARRPIEGIYGRPDRVAMWAFVLGVVLIVVALLGTPEASAATTPADRTVTVGMQGGDVRPLQLQVTHARS